MGTRIITTATALAGIILAGAGCGQSDRPALAWGARMAEAEDGRAAQAPTAAELTPRRLWAGDFVRFGENSVSPDGRYVTWADWSRDGIAVRDLQSDQLHWILDEPAYGAVFSRDGQRIAFAWHISRDGPDVPGLGLADFSTDGLAPPRASMPRVIYANPLRQAYPLDWSPDGQWVLGELYNSADATSALALVATTGDTARVLKSLGWRRVGGAGFSPDGRFVAFDIQADHDQRARHLYVVSVDGSRERLVVGGAAQNRLFAWAPDGSLLYQTDQDGAPSLWRQAMADGLPVGGSELLRRDFWRAMPIGFAGTTFHYGVVVDRPTLRIVDVDPGTGSLLGNARPVDHPLGGAVNAFAWSTDGNHLAVTHRERGGRGSRLAIRTVEGAEISEQPLLNMPWPMGLRWSHDGASVMTFGRDDRGRLGFHRVQLGTGSEDLVLRVEFGGARQRFDLSRDGATLYYVRIESPDLPSTLVRHTLATGEERSLGPSISPFPPPVVSSPDETELATVTWAAGRDTAHIAIAIPRAGGPYRELFRAARPGVITGIDWTPDGRTLLVAVSRQSTSPLESELWVVPVHGGEARNLEVPGGFNGRSVSLHPGGRRLAFLGGQDRGEIWALDLGAARTAAPHVRTSP